MKKTLDSLRVRAGVILAACALLLAGTAWADPPGRVVRLAYMNGPVSFLAAGDTEWVQAVNNRPLWTGTVWDGGPGRRTADRWCDASPLRRRPALQSSTRRPLAQFEVTQGAVNIVCERSKWRHIEIDAESPFRFSAPVTTGSTFRPTATPRA